MSSPGTRVEGVLAALQHGRAQFQLDDRTQLDDLLLRIREAAAWCVRGLDIEAIGTSLRASQLAPRAFPRDRWDLVDDVVYERRRSLQDAASSIEPRPRGRLLVYFPEAELHDGAAEVASRGFFDVRNAPPWATWIGYFDDGQDDPSYTCYLLAWAPEALVDVVGAGIDVNPEQCLMWFDDASVSLRSVLEPDFWGR